MVKEDRIAKDMKPLQKYAMAPPPEEKAQKEATSIYVWSHQIQITASFIEKS